MRNHRTRRQRRAMKARQKFGKRAAASHKLLHGRTGSFHRKLVPTRRLFVYSFHRPALTLSELWNVG
jgi:hypothetical protein